jgi:hypothetical protein
MLKQKNAPKNKAKLIRNLNNKDTIYKLTICVNFVYTMFRIAPIISNNGKNYKTPNYMKDVPKRRNELLTPLKVARFILESGLVIIEKDMGFNSGWTEQSMKVVYEVNCLNCKR